MSAVLHTPRSSASVFIWLCTHFLIVNQPCPGYDAHYDDTREVRELNGTVEMVDSVVGAVGAVACINPRYALCEYYQKVYVYRARRSVLYNNRI